MNLNSDERFVELVTAAMFEIASNPKYGMLRNLGTMSAAEEEQFAFDLASKAIEMAIEKFNKEKRLAEAYGYNEPN